MKFISVLRLFLVFSCSSGIKGKQDDFHDNDVKRDGKFLSLFQVVSFPNLGCRGSDKNGTCYTADECTRKGGTNAGSCAQGFGVCCIFSISCGGFSRENCTYIESNSPMAGDCRHTICPCNDNICQLRLDFDSFVITGPSTNANAETNILAGNIATNGEENSFASRCLTDTFEVTNTAGTNPPVICGINSGQHMYADVDRSRDGTGCNELNFQLRSTGIFAEIPNRQWSIKVSQIACNSPWRAPSGCTQYFLENSGTVQTYNYDGGQHLAFQRQSICVRRFRGQCRICWSAVQADTFDVSGEKSEGYLESQKCCGYDDAGMNTVGFDCLQIPVAMKQADGALIPNSRLCGRLAGLVSLDGKVAAEPEGDVTICSIYTPFVIRFISDGYEVSGKEEAGQKNKGFRLAYKQDSTNCGP